MRYLFPQLNYNVVARVFRPLSLWPMGIVAVRYVDEVRQIVRQVHQNPKKYRRYEIMDKCISGGGGYKQTLKYW